MKKIILFSALYFMATTHLFATKSIEVLQNQDIFDQGLQELPSGKISWISNKVKSDTTILFIHGNSACKETFVQQLTDANLNQFNLIAVDLPGHGQSDNAVNPAETYSFKGYAKTLIDFCKAKNLSKVIVCGWSLGGHIAIDMLAQDPTLVSGLFLTGTPPIALSMDGLMKGFKPFAEAKMMGQESTFTTEESVIFVKAGGIEAADAPFMIRAGERTHGLARKLMIDAMIGGTGGVDENAFIQSTECPIAFAHGATDGGINGEYIQSLTYKNLVGFYTTASGHAAHWEAAGAFNAHLVDFEKHVARESIDLSGLANATSVGESFLANCTPLTTLEIPFTSVSSSLNK